MRPRRRQRAPRRQKWLRPSPRPPWAAMFSVAASSVLLEGLLWLSDVLAGPLPKHPCLFTVNLHPLGLLACSLLSQPHFIWRKGAGPRRGVTGAVTSARCVSAGEGKVWPVRGAGVEGGTEGPGPGEAPVAAAAEAQDGTWTGPGSAGRRGAGGEIRRSFEPPPLRRAVTPHPGALRTWLFSRRLVGSRRQRLGVGRGAARNGERSASWREDRELSCRHVRGLERPALVHQQGRLRAAGGDR